MGDNLQISLPRLKNKNNRFNSYFNKIEKIKRETQDKMTWTYKKDWNFESVTKQNKNLPLPNDVRFNIVTGSL